MTRAALRLRFAAASIAVAAVMSVAPRAGAQDAGDAVTLRYKFAAGDRWGFDEDMVLKLKFNVSTNGKVAQAVDQTSHKLRKGDFSVIEAKGERLEALRARFGPECMDTEQAGTAEPQKKPTALAGQTVTVRRQAKGDTTVECAATLSDEEKKEARELIDPTEGWFAKKAVKVGDRWVSDEKAVARAFDLGPEDRGTLRMTLKALRDVAGRRTAEVAAALVVDQKQDFMKITLDLEGSLLIDVETGVAVGVDLRGPLTISGETEQAGEDGQPAKVTVDGGGECIYKSTARRLAAETGSAPASPPAPAVPPTPGRAEGARPGGLPLRIPEGWEGTKQEGALVIVPKDLPEGKIYTVLVLDLTTKIGSLKGLLDAGQASLGEVGTFKPARDPASSRNEAGWDYEVVIGTVEKDGGSLMAQALALRKGDEEGIVLVVSDSVETMQKYSDAFTAMIRSVGASAAPLPPAVPPASAGARAVDLKYQVPEGWTSKNVEGGIVLEKSLDDFYKKYTFRILILPSEPLEASLRQTFLACWARDLKPALETSIVPLPLVCRLKSGMACAYDVDGRAKAKNGNDLNGGLYILARGKRFVPIMGFFFGSDEGLEKAVEGFLESAEIPGSGTEKVALISTADLPGKWEHSDASYASYVTPSGGYAGDASMAIAEYLELKSDGTFNKTFIAVSRARNLNEKDEGKWTVEGDCRLTLSGKDTGRYSIFGVGADPKVGAFLVLSTYANTDERLRLSYPRAMFSGTWFKRKD